jgi:excisionase family DNA binding protein
MSEKFISVRDAAQILGVSEKRVIDLVDEGKITAYKIGGQFLRLNNEEIQGLKDSRLVEAENLQHKYTFRERLWDTFYYNDFYIASLLVIAALIYLIFKV